METTNEHSHPQHEHPINIIVEVDGESRHVSFDVPSVTGKQIRDKAGAQLTDDLVRIVQHRPTGGNIGLEQVVEIKNGDHFLALPTGSVS